VLAQYGVVVQRSLVASGETAKIQAVQRKLKADGPINLLKPTRLFFCETRTKKYYVALFNDLAIVAKPAGKAKSKSEGLYKVLKMGDLNTTEISDIDNKTVELKVEGEPFKLQCAVEEKADFMRWYKKAIEDINSVKVFGANLGETLIREERPVPYIVEKCAKFIQQHGVEQPGIFRVAGSNAEIQALKVAFDVGAEAADAIDFASKNIFSICDVLKLYFRCLPEPMLGYNLYRPIVDLMRDESMALPVRVKQIKELILMWTPPFAVRVLRFLLEFLGAIAQHSEMNKMTTSNLAIVFGPTLLWSEHNTLESAMDTPYVNSAVQIVIENYKQMF